MMDDDTLYMCDPCMIGACHRCTGCTCADDNHGGLLPPDPPATDPDATWKLNQRRLDAIADGTERGDPMG